MAMKQDLPKLQTYLRKRFNNPGLKVVMPPKKTDMGEGGVAGATVDLGDRGQRVL